MTSRPKIQLEKPDKTMEGTEYNIPKQNLPYSKF